MSGTKKVTAVTTSGDEVTLIVPTDTPSEKRAEHLQRVYKDHVRHPEGHWKGKATAVVSPEDVGDVIDAMNFMGSIVDGAFQGDEGIVVWSDGYTAHGFDG